MNLRTIALVGALCLVLGGLVAATIRPETWQQVVAFVLPTVSVLLVGARLDAQVKEYHVAVNSRMDDFIKIVEKASFAEGVKQEKERSAGEEVPKPFGYGK